MMIRLHACFTLLCCLVALHKVASIKDEIRCGSIDIRNNPKQFFLHVLSKQDTDGFDYKKCTIVEGDVTLAIILQNNSSSAIMDEHYPVFANLREITGSLLVYNVRGLTSLGVVFPNLRIIGGHSLIMNYALVIYQNQDLRNVGLKKLAAIKNGGVRITENTKLCYARYINWEKLILGKEALQDLIVEQDTLACGDEYCSVKNETACEKASNGVVSCWNSTTCQVACKYQKSEDGTPGPGCDENGRMCHSQCVGGCYATGDPSQCYACRNVELNGTCIPSCIDGYYEQMGRRCLTATECKNQFPVPSSTDSSKKSYWKPFHGKCHFDCPNGYEEDPNDRHGCIKCPKYCPKKCVGGIVESVASALKYRNCNIIVGFLEIEIRSGKIGQALTEAFGEIEEITEYLLIRFSQSLVSLHMFKKLHTIHGEKLYHSSYALSVIENANLRQLFNIEHQPLKILNGKVNLQNNAMLCYQRVEAFLEHVKLLDNITDNDVSKYSNGDKAICNEIPLQVKTVGVYNNAFVLGWTPFNTSDMDYRKFLGYQVFYKKVDKIDPLMTIDDDRSACADTWKMQFETFNPDDETTNLENGTASNGGAFIPGLESDTIYAYYVQTKLVNHPGARNAISNISFVRTLFGIPDSPRLKRAEATSSSTIHLKWDPPLNPQGLITHYKVEWQRINDTEAANNIEDPCNYTKRMHMKKPDPTTVISKSAGSKDTCSRDQGCCKCSESSTSKPNSFDISEQEIEEGDRFENTIQNTVFVQQCSVNWDPRHCQGFPPPNPSLLPSEMNEDEIEEGDVERRTVSSEKIHRIRVKRLHQHRKLSYEQHRMMLAWELFNLLYNEKPAKSKTKPKWLEDVNKRQDDTSPRFKRSIEGKSVVMEILDKDDLEDSDVDNDNEQGSNATVIDISMLDGNHTMINAIRNRSEGKLNVTSLELSITGLPHFTEYQILIYACQDVNAKNNACSQRPAWSLVRTAAKHENDRVNPGSVNVDTEFKVFDAKINDTRDNNKHTERRFTWESPTDPNSVVLGYRVKLVDNHVAMPYPIEHCISMKQYEEQQGYIIGLPDGLFTLEIRTITLAGESPPMILTDIVDIDDPGFFTTQNILIIVFSFLFIAIVGGLIIYYFASRYFGKKVREYVRQTISANPEYLSQLDVYQADEWELKRDDLELDGEIGRGTFGKVLKGYGKNVKSMCGVIFGECAVKTVPETASSAERLHFLIEASVMKQFNTSFIVRLYGVVSDGQPVLVVMEMMEKGNLRDFLRSHRPGAEENTKNRPVPTATQYFTWAAQIADGMAYLESLKFCHRDLAARNCMVHADETVKIGDFGMARDIYYHEYYKPAGKRLMPVRWMAPESLKDGKFTMKSDVWSYGVVLYEMLTLGQQPYNLMKTCWKYDPRERPSFHQIVRYLAPYTDKSFCELSYVLNNHEKFEGNESYNFDEMSDTHNYQTQHPMLQGINYSNSNESIPISDEEEEEDREPSDYEPDFAEPVCIDNRRDTDFGAQKNSSNNDLIHEGSPEQERLNLAQDYHS